MPLPTKNISFSAIQTEFGGSNPISLSEYYSSSTNYSSGVPYSTINSSGTSVPSSGQVSIGNLRGSWSIDPPVGKVYRGGAYAGLITIDGLQYRLILSPALYQESKKMTLSFFGAIAANSTSTNNGYANTVAIKALGNSTNYPAAWYATSISVAGDNFYDPAYTDWYLPSRDEWEICYRAFKSSTEVNITGNRTSIGDGLPEGTNAYSIPPRGGYTATDPPVTTLTEFQTAGNSLYKLGSANVSQFWTSSRSPTQSVYSYLMLGGSGQATVGTYHSDSRLVRPIRKDLRFSEAFNSASGWAGTTISPTEASMLIKIEPTGEIIRHTYAVSQSGTGFTSGSTSWRNQQSEVYGPEGWVWHDNYNYEIRGRLTTENKTGTIRRYFEYDFLGYDRYLNGPFWPELNQWGDWIQMTPAYSNWIGGGWNSHPNNSITLVGDVEIRNKVTGNVIASTFNITVTQTS